MPLLALLATTPLAAQGASGPRGEPDLCRAVRELSRQDPVGGPGPEPPGRHLALRRGRPEPGPEHPRRTRRGRNARLRPGPDRRGDPRARHLHPRAGGHWPSATRPPTPGPCPTAVVASEREAFKLELVAEGLETPWSVGFLPDGRVLVTEKPGRLRVVEQGRLLPQAVLGTPRVFAEDQAGLMDVAVHPDYAKNGWIYLAFTDPGPDGAAMTAIVRGRLRDGAFGDQETIYQGAPRALHQGRRSTSAAGWSSTARATSSSASASAAAGTTPRTSRQPNGKIHRVHDDGRVPADNPFVGAGGRPAHPLDLRQPQPAGPRPASRHRRPVGGRARPPRRRRAEPSSSAAATTAGRSSPTA